MKDFSKMVDFSTTKEKIITRVYKDSGLPIENINRLYESFAMQDSTESGIVAQFDSFLNVAIKKDSFSEFREHALAIVSKIVSAPDDATMDEHTIELIGLIGTFLSDASTDDFSALQMVCYLLSATDIDAAPEIQQLNESVLIDGNKLDVNGTMRGTSNFYEGLSSLLAKNNRRWGYNNHLTDAYSAIQSYLKQKIDDITNAQLFVEKNDSAHLSILSELLNTSMVNPIYRSVDNLKMAVSDIQTFVFDCVVLINKYFDNNMSVDAYINEQTIVGYHKAADGVYSIISSSRKGSKILTERCMDGRMGGEFSGSNYFMYFYDIDTTKLRYNHSINTRHVQELLTMVNACSPEFKLMDRRVLSNFVTKATEYLIKVDKISKQIKGKNLTL